MIFTIFTGCFGGGEETKKKKIEAEITSETSLSGWAQYDSQGDGGTSIVDEVFTLNLNSSRLIYCKVTVTLEDSDAEHADSDEGSDPDQFNVKLNSSGVESEIVSGSTPRTFDIEMPPKNATEEVTGKLLEFGPEVSIVLHANCGGGKPYKIIPGPIPRPTLLVYIDQGIAYSFNIEYTYLEEAGEVVSKTGFI